MKTAELHLSKPSGSLLNVYPHLPLTVERGQGCWFWDTDGRRYLDFVSGVGVNALGHAHPRVVRAIQEQASLCIHSSNLFQHPYREPLATRLAEWSGLSRVFFSNSGAEAVELALKAARAFANTSSAYASQAPRRRFVALEKSFHGRTTGALAVTGRDDYRRPFEPLFGDVLFIPANDADALARAVTSETAAVITETIQGEGGVRPLSTEFLCAVRRLTQSRGALWIADETQCGLGRTGERFAYQGRGGIDLPDIVVAAKPLAGGLPLGATIFAEHCAGAIGPHMHGSTFGGGPLACRTALEVLSVIEELLPDIRRMGALLFEALRPLTRSSPYVAEIRGHGLMAGLQLHVPGRTFVDACLTRGLAINCTDESVLRLLPPYIVTENEIDTAIAILEEVLVPH